MRLITLFELATRSETELRTLSRKVSEDLARANAPKDRANASKSLDNIAKAMQRRNEPKP